MWFVIIISTTRIAMLLTNVKTAFIILSSLSSSAIAFVFLAIDITADYPATMFALLLILNV